MADNNNTTDVPSDEEIAEYEKQESEASKNSRSKPRTNLGGTDR